MTTRSGYKRPRRGEGPSAAERERNTRGMRAFFTTCETLAIHPDAVPELRGHASRRFHEMWTAEMRRLARVEGEWRPEWDRHGRQVINVPHQSPRQR